MSSDQKVEDLSCECLNGHRTFGWKRSGFLVIIIATVMCAAIILPYITVVAQKTMPAFLPFISQAGGYPPQTGLLSVFLIILAFAGSVLFSVFYESINQRNRLNSKWVRRYNRFSLPIGILILLGCIVTASFPVGYTELPNLLEWIVTVLLEHSTGASMILVGMVIYQFFLAAIFWLLPDVTRTMKFIKFGFCIAYLIIFAIVGKPLPTFITEEIGSDLFNFEKLRNVTSYELPVVFSTNYKICSVAEWLICFLSLFNFLTMYKDCQRVSFHVALRHKTCLMEIPEPKPTLSLKLMA